MKQGEPTEKNMTFRLPIALMERLRVLAEHHHRALVGELLVAIEDYLHREERKAKRD
ncbi:MAG TPA: Arc family DNA-binding protein [Ktedonobacterales bacterium]|nr:Arc family DNA-binding protein [Ktedonobacterales bacterium]